MKYTQFSAIAIACLILWHSCVDHDLNELRSVDGPEINLRWVKAYPTETRDDLLRGLAWSFSFLGAAVPRGSLSSGIIWRDDQIFTVDIAKFGFSQEAVSAFQDLFHIIKNGEEYHRFGGMDVGRFIMLTLNSTNHYHAITGAKNTISEFRSQFIFDAKKAAVVQSTIAFGNRMIEISAAAKATEVAFVAIEGTGNLADNSFVTTEYECIDIMPNGQLRFALYDSDGALKTAGSPDVTRAGKPAKCLWCHEIHLIVPFIDNHELPTFYSSAEFRSKIKERVDLINAYRKGLISEIDFEQSQYHTKAELLYLSFMEPSVERLAKEWGISTAEVAEKVKHLAPHPHHEFSFLGDALLHRKDVEGLSPFENIATPDDPREYSIYEPDFIH